MEKVGESYVIEGHLRPKVSRYGFSVHALVRFCEPANGVPMERYVLFRGAMVACQGPKRIGAGLKRRLALQDRSHPSGI